MPYRLIVLHVRILRTVECVNQDMSCRITYVYLVQVENFTTVTLYYVNHAPNIVHNVHKAQHVQHVVMDIT